MEISVQDQIKLKFRNGAVCPHCSSKAVNKYGFSKGEQRYKCRDCGRTFTVYTKTLLNWCHHKDKWESFISTMGQDLSLRCAEKQVGVSYVTLFYWRHKVMNILNEYPSQKLHGTLELVDMPIYYMDKNYRKKDEDEDEEENKAASRRTNVYLALIYQRNNRLDAYLYKDRTSVRTFIYDLSENIDENSMVCLKAGIPFRHSLLHYKIKVADRKNYYKRLGYFNTDAARKYLSIFRNWLKIFMGVSTKNLIKYFAFFRADKIFNNMKGIILSYLQYGGSLTNEHARRGEFGY